MQQFDIVSIGDAVLDTFLSLENASEFARLRKETDELCIKEGAKVLIDDAQFLLGGNASNVSVGVSRLGFHASLFAEFGDDEFSQKLLKGLEQERVDLSHAIHTPHTSSTFSVILNLLGDRVAFIHHVQRNHAFLFQNISTQWLYLTSLGKEWHHVYKEVAGLIGEIRLAFNPGSAQIHEGRDAFADVLRVSDILFVNRDEAEILLHGKIPEKKMQETNENILFRLQRMGPKVVVMTDGEKGSYCMTDTAEFLYQEIVPCKVIEKTGAGDAYTSGFLAAVLSGKSYKEAMQWGSINSASVLGKVGAQPGLLTKENITERIKKE